VHRPFLQYILLDYFEPLCSSSICFHLVAKWLQSTELCFSSSSSLSMHWWFMQAAAAAEAAEAVGAIGSGRGMKKMNG
jgi:hypothetical protein